MKDRLSTTPVMGYPNFKLPFILSTDASKVAIVAILSQVQVGKERPIHLRADSSTQRIKTIVSEQEMLPLVWATKYLRCYVYGKRFVFRTDYAALTYLKEFAEHNSCLLRWSLKMPELDFVVERRAGSTIGHVDALSRHVGAITNPDPLSREMSNGNKLKTRFVESKK
jgi:hypothetical protein